MKGTLKTVLLAALVVPVATGCLKVTETRLEVDNGKTVRADRDFKLSASAASSGSGVTVGKE